ncbi:pantothenate synthetase [Stanieria cyanosphaera PCC 7437]|uniref:Bifunctional pantoate ligase/cytidylate kinase n=1 Tax=Stanieria cyanosphaera (strain ATCC 29371 / PCC 7437) TaxID=111780 RepID=K9XZL0_STAC7|nr:bifunctional pantoate--beta-alanine ligase/(d)CMP kinase [Stanieria cyanosphaera]AFZ37087.1 pantothenate synthetase [Stanieria cyanosphaera PCC 7437]
MLLFEQITELRSYLASKRFKSQIGLVPTMGALHCGHVSLIQAAIAQTDTVVVSIFVNPLQFTPTEDLQKYPRQLQQDLRLCEQLGVEVIFTPTVEEMGIIGDTESQSVTTTVVPPVTMTSGLCGRFRPGHFIGVATIVTKLLQIVQPHRAYFGQKDAQQLAIIRRLVADLNLAVEIVGCPIVREKSGLALSSRNQYLSATEKQQAAVIYRSLQQAARAFKQRENRVEALIDLVKQELATVPPIKIQYVELVDPQTLQPLDRVKEKGLLAVAAYLGSTRLIDNIVLNQHQPIIAIDGPAGAGKSTVTRRVAEQLGLLYLDTGAMYRAVTWLVMQAKIPIEDQAKIGDLIKEVQLDLIPADSPELPTKVLINGQDVTQAIRTPEVTSQVSAIAAQAAVRQELVRLQKYFGARGGVIAEGRDIGTNVFPDAELKIFLTATVAERARRRTQDLKNLGHQSVDIEQLAQEIQKRDEQDSNRVIAPLKKADDAIEIITDGLTIEQVTQQIIDLYWRRKAEGRGKGTQN